MNSRTDQTVRLPEALRAKFSQMERLLRRVDTVIAVCGALAGLLISYMLVFVSDRLWDTPGWLRGVFMLLGVGVAGFYLWGWWKLWVWHRRDTRALANVVQAHHRRLGDRLLGIVELADETSRPGNVSAALCRAAIAQVSSEAVRFDFREAVASRKSKILFVVAVLLTALVVIPSVMVPAASWNALTRWLGPMGQAPRFTFVSLEEVPEALVVPHGEAFEIACLVDFHPLWKSARARARYGEQDPVEGEVAAGSVLFRIPGQTEPSDLVLRVGDVTRRIAVEPRFRPALKEMTARIELPAYLQHDERLEKEIRNASLDFLEGSDVVLRGRADRSLLEATMAARQGDEGLVRETLSVRSDWFETEPVLLDDLDQLEFQWKAVDGLTNAPVWTLSTRRRTDGAPEAHCPNQAAAVAMLVDEVLDIQVAGRDDYGLKDLSVWWQCEEREGTNILARREVVLEGGSPRSTNLVSVYQFSPTLLELPEQTVVTLHALAKDYLPNRAPVRSQAHEIYILGHEEHARLVQEQFEKLLAEVEELTRRQESLLEETRAVAEMSEAERGAAETSSELAEQAAEQRAVAETTERLAKEGAETIREALRNREIPTDLLQEWTKQVEAMQELSQQQMAQASKSLASAASSQNPEEREAQTAEAQEREQEIVDRLREMQKKLGSALDQMMANTLAQRLRRISKFELDVRDSIRKMLPDTLGVEADQVPARHRATGDRLASGQTDSSLETRALEEEISRFYDRTSVTNYGTVSKEMKETKVVDALKANTELIRGNLVAQAMGEAGRFSEQFSAWAEQLDAANRSESESGSSESPSGGEMSEAALQRLLALLRTRQAEVNLRQHTQVLEAAKEGRSGYREDSILLAVRQSLVVDDVKALEEENAGKFLAAARESMKEAESVLLQPNTGAPAVAAETDAVNLLEAEIMSMMKDQGGQGQGQSQAMAMLMQMMGMGQGAGNMAGGNFSGGTTDRPNRETDGDGQGAAATPRQVEKTTGGGGNRPVPMEFRRALQNYHKAVEGLSP